MKHYAPLAQAHFTPGTRVIVRADFNVPLRNGVFADDFKVRQTLPTIDYLLKNKCPITLISHLGRPTVAIGSSLPSPELSLAAVATWLKEQGYDLSFCSSLKELAFADTPLTLLENIRFWPGEKKNDVAFAEELKKKHNVFVHDAFGSLQNNDCSLVTLPTLFPATSRYAGFLLTRELSFFETFFKEAHGKCLLIVAGGKIDKLERLYALLTVSRPIPSTVVIGGKLIEAFITNQEIAQKIQAVCQKHKITLIVPHDGIFNDEASHSLTTDNVAQMLDIGAQSTKEICDLIAQSSHIIANCFMGRQKKATQKIIDALAQSSGVTALTGGDSAHIAHEMGLEAKMTFVSTGGGAILALLAHADNFYEIPSLHLLSGEAL